MEHCKRQQEAVAVQGQHVGVAAGRAGGMTRWDVVVGMFVEGCGWEVYERHVDPGSSGHAGRGGGRG